MSKHYKNISNFTEKDITFDETFCEIKTLSSKLLERKKIASNLYSSFQI